MGCYFDGEKKCEWCGNIFTKFTSAISTRYCSQKCEVEAMEAKVSGGGCYFDGEKNCEWCGRTFTKFTPAKNTRYCSKKCEFEAQ